MESFWAHTIRGCVRLRSKLPPERRPPPFFLCVMFLLCVTLLCLFLLLCFSFSALFFHCCYYIRLYIFFSETVYMLLRGSEAGVSGLSSRTLAVGLDFSGFSLSGL